MPNFLIDLLKKTRFKKSTDSTVQYYSVMKHGASIPVTSIKTQASFNNNILPGSNISVNENTTTTSTTTTTTTSIPTTTTTTSTTTSTTTLPAGIYAFNMKYSAIGSTQACAEVTSGTYYSNSATLNAFAALTIDSGLVTEAPAGYYCLAAGCPNSTGKQWIQVGAFGSIGGSAFC